jgi:alkylation response protein AidB-like acyl-CoA dehydrogenase
VDEPGSPALKELLAELSELAAQHRAEGDRLRRLPPALAGAFRRLDVYRLIVPADLGGAAESPVDCLKLVEGLARVDGSTAWTLSIGIGSALYGGYIQPDRARELFATADCCIAGAYAPSGRGRTVPGGYRVEGRWGWASGVHQARWMVLGFAVEPEGVTEGAPVMLQALAPRADFRILDNWHVAGMRGTGSTDYEADDLFIPAAMTFRMFLDEPRHPAPLFRLPGAFFAAAIAVVPLGIARSSIDGLARLAAAKPASRGRPPLREQTSALYAVAKAQAMVDSASLYLHDAIGAVWNSVQAGRPVGLAQRARARRAAVHAAEASAEAVDLCAAAAGGHALFESEPFERALRDVRATLGHIVLARGAMEDAGRPSFGLAPQFPVF